VVTAEQRRAAVTHLVRARRASLRRACRLVGISRASYGYVSRRAAADAPVRARLRGGARSPPRTRAGGRRACTGGSRVRGWW
jgi:hypothetical protein